jgi:hypothetical protein
MGYPVEFKGASHNFSAPPGEEERCGSLPCFLNGTMVVSAWKLTPEELEAVKETGVVYISMWSGTKVWPHFVGSESSVRGLVVDFGKPF